MKICCVQFWPEPREVNRNIAKVNRLLSRYSRGDFEILLLPEMCMTGYVFEDRNDVYPFCEDANGNGKIISWAKETALRFNAFVQFGFAEKRSENLYNSICLISKQGTLVTTYQKHFLYEMDETWATEGQEFKTVDLNIGKVGFGICMDLNPYKFEAPFDAYEFANFQVESGSRLLLCCMAWLLQNDGQMVNSNSDSVQEIYSGQHENVDSQVIRYWFHRLYPLFVASQTNHSKYTVVIRNRTGQEQGTVFCGSSCAFTISDGKIDLHGSIGRGVEYAKVFDCDL